MPSPSPHADISQSNVTHPKAGVIGHPHSSLPIAAIPYPSIYYNSPFLPMLSPSLHADISQPPSRAVICHLPFRSLNSMSSCSIDLNLNLPFNKKATHPPSLHASSSDPSIPIPQFNAELSLPDPSIDCYSIEKPPIPIRPCHPSCQLPIPQFRSLNYMPIPQ